KGTGGRAKTDASDAQLLARHLQNEKGALRRWSPPPKAYRTLQTLLRRRAALVKARTIIQQSLGAEPLLKAGLKRLISQINTLDAQIQKHL
ncbi:transposase, partial [Alcanivorax sp. HI0044]